MMDKHRHDLEIERQDREGALEVLKKKLSSCTDQKTKIILNKWMQRVSEGTEHEAQQLLAFFRAWDAAHGSPGRSGRDFREDAVKCGLSRAVDLHFTALNMKQRVIGTASLDLLRWAIYGHWGCTRQEKQEDDIKNMIRAEARHEYETGEKISKKKLADTLGVDRKKIRKSQEKAGYRENIEVIKAVLKKSSH